MNSLYVVIETKIPVVLLIIIAAVMFIGAFIVCPFFLTRPVIVKRASYIDVSNKEKLLERAKSLSNVEVNGKTLSLTRASDVKNATYEIAAYGSGKFSMKKKIQIGFLDEDTVNIQFKENIISLRIVEVAVNSKAVKGNNMFMKDGLSAFIIAVSQFLAVGAVIALTIFAFESFNFNVGYFPRVENYYLSYISEVAALFIGIASYAINIKKMKAFKYVKREEK